MSEITGEVQVTSAQRGVKGLLHRAHHVVTEVAKEAKQVAKEAIFVGGENIPLEKITPETMAFVINNSVKNSFLQALGEDENANGFTLPLVLKNAGHIKEGDYMEGKKRLELLAGRKALQALVDEGSLTMEQQARDFENESILYRVADKERLKKSAERGKEQLLRK